MVKRMVCSGAWTSLVRLELWMCSTAHLHTHILLTFKCLTGKLHNPIWNTHSLLLQSAQTLATFNRLGKAQLNTQLVYTPIYTDEHKTICKTMYQGDVRLMEPCIIFMGILTCVHKQCMEMTHEYMHLCTVGAKFHACSTVPMNWNENISDADSGRYLKQSFFQ